MPHKCRRQRSLQTGPIGRSARPEFAGDSCERKRDHPPYPSWITRPVATSILRRDCREFKVTVATKISPGRQVTTRSGKHEAVRSRVRYLCRRAAMRVTAGNRAISHTARTFLRRSHRVEGRLSRVVRRNHRRENCAAT